LQRDRRRRPCDPATNDQGRRSSALAHGFTSQLVSF
jgi:hypothetical protein